MNGILFALAGTLFTFAVTTVGASTIFLIRNELSNRLQCGFLGFAGGVMVAASIWSLLLPGIEFAESNGQIGWITVTSGFVLGVITLLLSDLSIKKWLEKRQKNHRLPGKGTLMLTAAITMHNIPEGMSIGLAFALAVRTPEDPALFAGACALSLGIAIQNFPEGSAVALPLVKEGFRKRTAFFIASMTAFVEPVFGVLAAAFAHFAQTSIALLLAFAAGTMIYVVVEELIPEAHTENDDKSGTLGFIVGFLIMMILDVALG
ncbi:MAG: ZIP family metal transporter [Schaedlerella sp.]|nr:ZIP family metal transporter [Schaedlerella sp.]